MATGHAKTTWCTRPGGREKESKDERDKRPGEAYLDTKTVHFGSGGSGGSRNGTDSRGQKEGVLGGIGGPVIPGSAKAIRKDLVS